MIRNKFIVIAIILFLLVFTISKMMKYEESIRQDHIFTKYIEDDSKPLLEKLNKEQLADIVNKLNIQFKTGAQYFKIKEKDIDNENNWNTILLKGVNIGAALPGKFPAEFSLTFEGYLSWLIDIGEMNANTIRLYTILPPEFYRAFAYYNLHFHTKPIFLMQGVWATVPEDKDYYNLAYKRSFKKEIIDVIDVLNGNAFIKKQPGKAYGVYTTDVSGFVIGILLGREWEPKSVFQSIKKNSNTKFIGDFISISNANPMETWLAEMMDYTILNETQKYQKQFPISFVNWLPLDNLYHNTEFIENKKVREYDNDLISLDFRKFNSTPLFKAGIYASYHVYPYYPDFINEDNKYKNTLNKQGQKDNFYGYLKDLKKHNKGLPMIIAEYGLPSSRGISHFAYSGFHQGGHNEKMQAEKGLILTKDIFDSECAGALYFEWVDEWFKHNWLVIDFERPFEHRKLWHNMENPEQNFGIVALEDKVHNIDGKTDDWQFNSNDKLTADADATYFYLLANLPKVDLGKNNIYIAIDTYDKTKGDHKLPFSDKRFENGFEFLCAFKSKEDANILVDDKYSVYTDIYNDSIPVYSSKENDNAKFIHQYMLVNRGRETLKGVKSDSLINDRSPLLYGNSKDSEFSNCDWNFSNENNILELRLDWHLINVSDPSHRYVLDDNSETRDIEASKTDGFNIKVFITDKNNNLVKEYPENEPYFFTWDEWEKPIFTQRQKPLYDSLQLFFKKIRPHSDSITKVQKEEFAITDYYGNNKSAISISFDNAGYSQYQYAFPILNKYNLRGSFGVINDILDVNPSFVDYNEGKKIKRLGIKEVKELIKYGNDISLQTNAGDYRLSKSDILSLVDFSTVHYSPTTKNEELKKNRFVFVKKPAANSISEYRYSNVNYNLINTDVSEKSLDSILLSNQGKWNILQYYHIQKDTIKNDSLETKSNNPFVIDWNKFRKQIRLVRNTGYWIAPESNVFKYIKEKQKSKLKLKRYGNTIYLNVNNRLDPRIYNQPLTVKYTTNSKILKISGSASDGYHSTKTGVIYFDVYPNKEVKIEIEK